MIEHSAIAGSVAEDHARSTLDSIGDAVVGSDIACRVTYLNAVAEQLTGWSHEDAAGRPLGDVLRIVDASTRELVENPMARAIVERRTVALAPNCVMIGRNGVESAIEDSAAPIRAGGGAVRGAVMVFRDVSAARAHAQRMEHLAQHDSLTDLANRVLLDDRLTQAIALARREQRRVALLFVDVDHFKSVNDSLGHDGGDRLLRSVALRLLGCVRTSDTVSRIGGDEFVILLPEVARVQDASLTAGTILRAFDRPHLIDQHELRISVSIGIATFPDDGGDAAALVARADLAMYRAKATSRRNFESSSPIVQLKC
jgi:diguanylate cyclase (GGDEF)-like protein/PAS domain S-box-containing protein